MTDTSEETRPSDQPMLVPFPVELRIVTVVSEGQQVSEEQRERVGQWLQANGIDHRRVTGGPITIESKMRGDVVGRQVIGFWEYYETPEGTRVINEKTLTSALTYQRWVEQTVPLEPDPDWDGWEAYHQKMAEQRRKS